MSFSFQDITDYTEDLINDGVEFVGDGVKSVSDTVSGFFGDGGNELDVIHSEKEQFDPAIKRYPETIGSDYNDPFIMVTFKEISTTMDDVAAREFQSTKLLSGALKVGATKGAAEIAAKVTDQQGISTIGGVAAGVAAFGYIKGAVDAISKTFDEKPLRHPSGMVALYMPSSIQISDSANYDAMSRQALALAAEASKAFDATTKNFDPKFGQEGEGKILASAMAGETMMGGGLIGGAAGAVGLGSMAGAAAMGEVIKLVGDEELRLLGKALNPNEYMQFKSVNLRQFNLSFKFLPDSQTESEHVEEIIKMFRKAMYPIEHSNLTMTVPDVLDIQFHNVAGMVKMPELALTNVNLTYNPNAASFFKQSGYPVEIAMDITLQELYPIHRAEVEEGDY